MLVPDQVIGIADEADGVEILAAAVLVRHPLARRTAVIEIQHRCNRVDAQAVDSVAFDPEQRVGAEEIADLVASVVVDERLPVLMKSLARILVLEKRRPVEAAEAMRIVGKVSGHPIEDHAEARCMHPAHEFGERFRVAVARGRRIKPERLIAPGAVEWMLHHRQQLDVSELHLLQVRDQLVGDLRP